MRKTFITLAATLMVLPALLGLGPVGSTLGPVPADAATSACSMTLDPDRRMVYRLRAGDGDVLSYGRVVVHATKANRHKYCVRFQTGGRTVVQSWQVTERVRSGGECGRLIGYWGLDPHRHSGFNRTMVVRDKTCQYQSFRIKHNGRWFGTTIMRYNA